MVDWSNFLYFVRSQLFTGDYDAHIPFIKELCSDLDLNIEERLWIAFLYMGYYTEGSMYIAFSKKMVRNRKLTPPDDLPITTQRRNLYGGRIQRHWEELHEITSLSDWLGQSSSWSELMELVGSVYGNGRWAKYTTSELLVCVSDLEHEPDSFEILDSSGPKKGLSYLGLGPGEESAELVHNKLSREGIDIPFSQLESLLCDWAGMNKGTFYAGRNIDRQQGRILQVEEKLGTKLDKLWEIRSKVFPPETLGELNGWEGIDKERLKTYRDKNKKVLLPQESR